MKRLLYILTAFLPVLFSCSREEEPETAPDGSRIVTIDIPVEGLMSGSIDVGTRATADEERALDNLYVYVFNTNGKIKGFAKVTRASELKQDTDNTHRGSISITTTAGDSYIYAVANTNTGLYPLSLSNGLEENKLPVNITVEDAYMGRIPETVFSRQKFLALSFSRNNPSTVQVSGRFLMTGAVNGGNAVKIGEDGSVGTSAGQNILMLRRVVSKIRLNVGVKSTAGVTRSFKAESYDLMNVALNGSLFSSKDAGKETIYKLLPVRTNFSNITGNIFAPNDISDGRQFFEVYLPENLQTQNRKADVTSFAGREADTQTGDKQFTAAPEYGSYIVLKGSYSETTSSYSRNASVTYYIHLGDADMNNYDIERNYNYTYNVTVAGVDNIIVEASKEGNDQPGAEGVVMEYGSAGKTLDLDSHYEYMVMRFYQNDIMTLKAKGRGYIYQVSTFGSKTDAMSVDDQVEGDEHGVDTDWIEFAVGGTYDATADEKGTPCSYPGRQNLVSEYTRGGAWSGKIFTVQAFLRMLYVNADVDSFWTGRSSSGRYIDATCFIDENYYSTKNWSEFVNDVPKRSFYVANEVKESTDGRSVYATVAYGLTQYNIQTFYDRDKDGEIVAYGCETTNDEAGKGFSPYYASSGVDSWNGRNNMYDDVVNTGATWSTISSNKTLRLACMSRNRDLNGDGVIDADEIRWYAPTINQYAGFWIGENVISAESRLYNKLTSSLGSSPHEDTGGGNRMIYWSSTSNMRSYFSEEGMATNNASSGVWSASYVRCARNLKSHDSGYDQEPARYFSKKNDGTYDEITLDNVDSRALNVTGDTGELNNHNERQDDNKPARKFLVAPNRVYGATMETVTNGTFNCAETYETDDGKKWRVPNQREYMLVYFIRGGEYNTFCRTSFSNISFRYSWTYDGSNFTMYYPDQKTSGGSVRCISVEK